MKQLDVQPSPIRHWLLQANRIHAQAILKQWFSPKLSTQAIDLEVAKAIGQLQRRGEPLTVANVERAVGLVRLPQLMALANAPKTRSDAIDRLRERANVYHWQMQTLSGVDAATAAAPVQKKHWLDGASAERLASDNEYAAIESLMRHYGASEAQIKLSIVTLWQDVYKAARTEAQQFHERGQLPPDVVEGRTSELQFFYRLASVDNYIGYLKGDAPAYSVIAARQVTPRFQYQTLQADSNNSGVLRTAELQASEREPFVRSRLFLMQMAYWDTHTQMARDWSGAQRPDARPAYLEFAQYVNSASFEELLPDMHPKPSRQSRQAMLYQARWLDYIGQTEKTASNKPEEIPGLVEEVEQQIQMMRERGMTLTGINDSTLDAQAETLLYALVDRLRQKMRN